MAGEQSNDTFTLRAEPVVGEGSKVSSSFTRSGPGTDLPQSSQSPLLVVIARDPHTLFAYWDVDWAGLFRDTSREQPIYLRVSGGAKTVNQLIRIEPWAGSSYLTVEGADQCYVVELGYYKAGADWNVIAKADSVVTPRDRMSEEGDYQLVTLPLHLEFQQLVESAGALNYEPAEVGPALAQVEAKADRPARELTPGERRLLEQISREMLARHTAARLQAGAQPLPGRQVLQAKWERLLRVASTSSSDVSSS
jgi:hypothetical protein